MHYDNILSLIGNTPLVSIDQISKEVQGKFLAKLEYFNPGNSIKDRIALRMITDAEKEGKLKPGGTIIEATSGNTGMGLACIAAAKGYKCLFTISDKQSKEKIDILRAMGAEIKVCRSDVSHDHPESYYAVAKKLSQTLPNAFFPFQYDNLSNRVCHYETTGPEIWKQSAGKVTHYVAGIGTGGTISGVGKFLKEKNPAIKVLGVEPEGSIFSSYKATGTPHPEHVLPHYTEGIGSDFIPKNLDIHLIDEVLIVSDKRAAWAARDLAKTEGILAGWSCGAVLQATLDHAAKHPDPYAVYVMLLPDHGSRYVQKIYNDQWMKKKGYWKKELEEN